MKNISATHTIHHLPAFIASSYLPLWLHTCLLRRQTKKGRTQRKFGGRELVWSADSLASPLSLLQARRKSAWPGSWDAGWVFVPIFHYLIFFLSILLEWPSTWSSAKFPPYVIPKIPLWQGEVNLTASVELGAGLPGSPSLSKKSRPDLPYSYCTLETYKEKGERRWCLYACILLACLSAWRLTRRRDMGGDARMRVYLFEVYLYIKWIVHS